MAPTIDDSPAEELADVRAGWLPARYGQRMQDVMLSRLAPLLADGVTILDVGAGRSPTLGRERRPADCTYIGLDICAAELAAAPPGSYDRVYAHDISRPLTGLCDVDVIISWQVLEHVASLPAALCNLRATLRDGGTLLAQLSGSFALFSLAARAMPHRLRVRAMERWLGHAEELKFPTRYDRCHARALRRALGGFAGYELICFYRGAPYLAFSRSLQRLYLLYEDLIAARGVENLATHYLIVARA